MAFTHSSQVISHSSASLQGIRLVVYAGPTGGHIFPAQSFSEGFRKRFPDSQIALVTCHRAQPLVEKMPRDTFHTVSYLPEFGIPAGFSLKTLKPFFLFPYLLLHAFALLCKVKPNLCVGFGSFVSYPGMLAASWLGIPTLAHEQNFVPGKATQWLVPHVDIVAESFEGTKFLKKPKKLCTVGLPLRSFILDAARKPHEKVVSWPLTILVVGGSQGAQGLNETVADAMALLSNEERTRIAVIHIAGARDLELVREKYRRLGLSCEVHPFYSAMDELFLKADLAVTRAGANTLFELAAFGVPAFVIPYPHAGGHQRYNAQNFAERDGLFFHDEDPAAKGWLVERLRRAIAEPESLEPLSKAMKVLARSGAVDKLIKIAQEMIKSHENHTR